MSDLIQVPYTELFQRATRIRQQADIVSSEIENLAGVVDGIQWIGQRAERFFNMWAEAEPEMRSWVQILRSFADDLENQARRMQAADEAF
ncbi:MAG TPA: WXG100 family type VII secretion target [Oceanobacillus sp.]|nr:WXG100 family type VII secretion target [Oceanobacillus sp.]